VRNKGS